MTDIRLYRILLVDDVDINIRTLADSFQNEYDFSVALDGKTGLELAQSYPPDLILLDIVMPGMDGIKVCRHLKTDQATKDIPVIFLTVRNEPEDITAGFEAGAVDYIAKPFNIHEVRARIRVHLELKRSREALESANSQLKTEIAARLELHESLQKSEARLNAVFRSIPEGIITIDTKGNILQVNPPLGRIACEAVRQCVPGDRLDPSFEKYQCFSMLFRLMKTGKAVSEYSVNCIHCGFPERRLSLTTSPLLDPQDRIAGALLVIRDITRLVELEIQLGKHTRFRKIIGQSRLIQNICTQVKELADKETTVLISGETGTGKELVAEAIHYTGSRSKKPLIRVNCAMFTEALMENELFGHVRGAFTGAVTNHSGRFQEASGGTLFLDEIGELSLHLQAKLLRVMDRKEFEPVGSSRTVKADVRIIAASNADMKEQVRQGLFRMDLYHRLKVVEIQVPPLRERREDIPVLTKHFQDMYAKAFNKHFVGISERVLNVFMQYPWPGNVRELSNIIEHACIFCPGGMIRTACLPMHPEDFLKIADPVTAEQTLLSVKDKPSDSEKNEDIDTSSATTANSRDAEAIFSALKRTGWNKAKAARILGISRGRLYRRLLRYGISTGEPDNR